MQVRRHRGLLCAGAVLLSLHGAPSRAQFASADVIRESALIDVPLVLGEIDADVKPGSLWVLRREEGNGLLARFTVRPVQVATIEGAGEAPPLLWRAFAGGGITRLRAEELPLTEGARTFCGPAGARGDLSCFIDEDGDGRFERVAEPVTERGAKPYHVTIIKAAQPLPAPLPYRVLADAARPALTVELRNCDRDYDRPRYAALSTADRDVPARTATLGWPAKDSSFASCRRGGKMAQTEAGVAIPKGGYLAEIGPMAFTVGPKREAALTLVGPIDRQALYRLEGASLIDMRIGRTPNQAQLAAIKQFPFPALMTEDGAAIHDGPLATGEELASLPFRHAYHGRLTRDISISTLLGKRMVAAGTILYGFPTQSRLTQSRNGIPMMGTIDDEDYRRIDLKLTWCAPVREAEPGEDAPDAAGKNGWSAACIPHSVLGNHTIINGLQPAFAVKGIRYDAATSSDDGPPPIERLDTLGFDQPLRISYFFEGRSGDFITLSERIYYGGELASSMPKQLYARSGEVAVTMAGATTLLKLNEAGALRVTPISAPIVGADPMLEWDQRAMLMAQFEKMGLKIEGAGQLQQ